MLADLCVCVVSLSCHVVQECCYRPRNQPGQEALLINMPDGGNAIRYSQLAFNASVYAMQELLPHDYCCVRENLCGYFYERRPSGASSGYEGGQTGQCISIPAHFLVVCLR